MNSPKINIPQFIIPVFILFFNAIMIIFPKEIFLGAKNGLEIWFNTVVPSVLPFMITINILVGLGVPRVIGRLIQPVTLRLFRLTGTQAFVLLVGLTAGFPLGLKLTAQLYRSGEITKPEAYRLMLFCNNAGAMFVTGTVGAGFFSSAKAGYYILLCGVLSVFTLVCLSGIFSPAAAPAHTPVHIKHFDQALLSSAMENAGRAALFIGGYIILFSVLMQVCDTLHLFDAPARVLALLGLDKQLSKAAAAGFFEMTNGCQYAAGGGRANIITAAVLCGWGGLSVYAQSIQFLGGTDLSCIPYIAGKALTALLCFCYAVILWGIFR